jgi:hypothetical protein
MYINARGCDSYASFPYDEFPELCTNPTETFLAYLFFPLFVMIGNIVLLTLFIGIVCAEMDSMHIKQEVHDKCLDEVREFQEHYNIPDKQASAYMKLFELVQGLKPGYTDTVDFEEMKGMMQLLELVNGQDEVTRQQSEVKREAKQQQREDERNVKLQKRVSKRDLKQQKQESKRDLKQVGGPCTHFVRHTTTPCLLTKTTTPCLQYSNKNKQNTEKKTEKKTGGCNQYSAHA